MALKENKDKWERQRRPEQIEVDGQGAISHRHLILVHPGTFASGLAVGGAIILFTDCNMECFSG